MCCSLESVRSETFTRLFGHVALCFSPSVLVITSDWIKKPIWSIGLGCGSQVVLTAVVLPLAKVRGIPQFSSVRYSAEQKVSETCVRWEIEDRPAYLCVRESRRKSGGGGERKYVFVCQWERLFSVIQGDCVWAPQPVCFVSCPRAGLQFLLDSLRGPVWF